MKRTPLRAKGGRRIPSLVDEGLREFARQGPCLLDARGTCTHRVRRRNDQLEMVSDPAHLHAKNHAADENNLVRLCSRHHRELHDTGIETFQAKYDLDLMYEAIKLSAEYNGGEAA